MKYGIVAVRVGIALSVLWVLIVFTTFTSVIRQFEGPVLFGLYQGCRLWQSEALCDAAVFQSHDLALIGSLYLKICVAALSLIIFWLLAFAVAVIAGALSAAARR